MEYQETEQACLEECNPNRTELAGTFFVLICSEKRVAN
jgi:hypothetical protein